MGFSTPMPNSQALQPSNPIEQKFDRFDQPDDGIALCLSGGGFRAMLFHLGSLWRLNEWGLLPKIDLFSSVSGGSITNGVLARHWSSLAFDSADFATNFFELIASPIMDFAGARIDLPVAVAGLLAPGLSAKTLSNIYERHLFGPTTLQGLPDHTRPKTPKFLFNTTSLETGVDFRFTRAFAGDYKIGLILSISPMTEP